MLGMSVDANSPFIAHPPSLPERRGRAFFYSSKALLLALIPSAVGLLFGAELALFRFVFPKDAHWILKPFGFLTLAAGLLGFVLVVRKLLRPKPFLILSPKGLYADVLLRGNGYLFLPWEVVSDVGGKSRRTGPADAGESALMQQASTEDLLALQLGDRVVLPRFMVQVSDLGEGWLGLHVNLLDASLAEIEKAVREVWISRTVG